MNLGEEMITDYLRSKNDKVYSSSETGVKSIKSKIRCKFFQYYFTAITQKWYTPIRISNCEG